MKHSLEFLKSEAKKGIIYNYSGTQFIVTGYYYNSDRKFRNVFSNFYHAEGINLWNGKKMVKYTGMKRAIVYSEVFN